MSLNPIICTQCGSPIRVSQLSTIILCPSCGTSFFTSNKELKAKENANNIGNINSYVNDIANIQLVQIDQPIIRGSMRNGLKQLLEILSILAYYQKQDYVCAVNEEVSIFSRDIVNKEKYALSLRNLLAYYDENLPKWGFEIARKEFVPNRHPYMVFAFNGAVLISPEYYNTIWNKELGDTVHRMLQNETIIRVSDDICKQINQYGEIITQGKITNIQPYDISVFEEGITYDQDFIPVYQNIHHGRGSKKLYDLGFNRLNTKELRIAFAISVLVLITGKLNNWCLSDIDNQEFSIGINGDRDILAETKMKLIPRFRFEKQLKDW